MLHRLGQDISPPADCRYHAFAFPPAAGGRHPPPPAPLQGTSWQQQQQGGPMADLDPLAVWVGSLPRGMDVVSINTELVEPFTLETGRTVRGVTIPPASRRSDHWQDLAGRVERGDISPHSADISVCRYLRQAVTTPRGPSRGGPAQDGQAIITFHEAEAAALFLSWACRLRPSEKWLRPGLSVKNYKCRLAAKPSGIKRRLASPEKSRPPPLKPPGPEVRTGVLASLRPKLATPVPAGPPARAQPKTPPKAGSEASAAGSEVPAAGSEVPAAQGQVTPEAARLLVDMLHGLAQEPLQCEHAAAAAVGGPRGATRDRVRRSTVD
jgi:hypothetical protein